MMSKKQNKRFDHVGPHSEAINKWFLSKAETAIKEEVSALDADYSWTTFQSENPLLVQAIARDHPSTRGDDINKKVRSNLESQRNRFIKWLITASGKFSFGDCYLVILLYSYTSLLHGFPQDIPKLLPRKSD